MIADSELIRNADGRIYHLNMLPQDLAPTIIFLGDPDRVGEVSRYFDRIDVKKGNGSLSPIRECCEANGFRMIPLYRLWTKARRLGL